VKLQADWLLTPQVEKLAALYPEARFVGGCVRNTLLQKSVSDLDVASSLLPEEVMARAKTAGYKVVPTGIDHGTVTVVIDKKPFEITTLRHDIETDGRHAKVTFTTDWAEDARRRDFTINALYADFEGNVYDYVGGMADIETPVVRFIGNPAERLAEDYLRILRFFRFHAVYGQPEGQRKEKEKGSDSSLDAEGLKACKAAKDHLKTLSAERIRAETLKLLEAKNPVPVWALMLENGIWADILPEATNLNRLENVVALEAECEAPPDPVRRLAALLESYPEDLQRRLALSRKQADRLEKMLSAPVDLSRPLAEILYYEGGAAYEDAAFLAGKPPEDVREWHRPTFPLTGHDVMEKGVSGKQVGALLSQVERWWVAENFQPDKNACLSKLAQLLQG